MLFFMLITVFQSVHQQPVHKAPQYGSIEHERHYAVPVLNCSILWQKYIFGGMFSSRHKLLWTNKKKGALEKYQNLCSVTSAVWGEQFVSVMIN